MSYTRFDRHVNMDDNTRSEIMSIIKDIRYDDTLDGVDNILDLENMLYGMFDGYLYENVQLYALELPTKLASRITKVYDICNRYPKLQINANL